jgi:nucleoid DNA-binding protein
MTHEELITTVSRQLDWPESQTTRLLGTLTALLKEKLLENLPVSIDDFGIFSTCLRPEFISLNPETKERYLIPPAIEVVFEHAAYLADPDLPQISFEPEESLRESVNSSFACFEPTRINEGVQFPDIPEIIAEEYREEEISEYERDERHHRADHKRTKRKKTSAAWIPIMSGVAIVLAGLIIGASTGHSGRSKSRR